MFTQASALSKNSVRTGYSALDNVLASGALATLRSRNAQWLSHLAASALVHSHSEGKRTLLLQWLDYHDRYWAINHDAIVRMALRKRMNPSLLLENTLVQRVFSRDGVEEEENWKPLYALRGLTLAVLDSATELFRKKTPGRRRNANYALSRFARVCAENECVGLVLDYADAPLNPVLAGLSSCILEFDVAHDVRARVLKHSSLPEHSIVVERDAQRLLREWNA